MNVLEPGCIKKIDKKGGGFALMQNIERFNKAIVKYGVPVREVFQTVDLWEKKNIPAVTLCVHALGRIVSSRYSFLYTCTVATRRSAGCLQIREIMESQAISDFKFPAGKI